VKCIWLICVQFLAVEENCCSLFTYLMRLCDRHAVDVYDGGTYNCFLWMLCYELVGVKP